MLLLCSILIIRKEYLMKEIDLTKGTIFKKLILFALPMILGNLLQQIYNIVDTLIVGRFVGNDALASVGSAYSNRVMYG